MTTGLAIQQLLTLRLEEGRFNYRFLLEEASNMASQATISDNEEVKTRSARRQKPRSLKLNVKMS
ncbi:hypothetical protein Plhal304r1_c023g0080461 [Plasmopara halstedii]